MLPPILETLVSRSKDDLAGLPNAPTHNGVVPKSHDAGGESTTVIFWFPNGLRIDVEKYGASDQLAFAVFYEDSPVEGLRMTDDGTHRGTAWIDGMMGRLIAAASNENPAALLLSDRRHELRENAREKLLEDWELSRWEKLVFAKTLLDESLPNR